MLLAFRALHRSPLRRSFSLAGGFTYPAPRRLDDVLKLDLLRRESKEKIEAIWNEFYITKEFNIASAWDSKEFEDFKAASKKNGGLFIFPVKRPGTLLFNVTSAPPSLPVPQWPLYLFTIHLWHISLVVISMMYAYDVHCS